MHDIKYTADGIICDIIFENGTFNLYMYRDYDKPVHTGNYESCCDFINNWNESIY